jgi:hypothetical protein
VSDTRFTLLGIGLIFAGFIVLGIFGGKYFDVSIQAEEFDTCYEYFDDRPPVPVQCDVKLQNKAMFSGLVIGLIGVGIASLVKGVRGRWDQDVKPEDMVGPGDPSYPSSDESKSFGKKD